ncbi:MAG: AmmeMemoRadiSam system protein B [Gemmataceae bacterium]
MSAELERPCLRPFLAASQDHDPRHVVIWDRLNLCNGPQRLSLLEFSWVQLFDGKRTLRQIQAEAIKLAKGQPLPLEQFTALAARLDEALYLDSPRFHEKLAEPIRAPACIGCYAGDPDELRQQMRRLFTGPRGSGLPDEKKPDGTLRGALVPHIDYARGGTTYTWAFKEVVERSDARLFVIIATSHYSPARFTLTRKHFLTPLGVIETDQGYIDKLVAHFGDGLFEDPLAHLPEHSIELEVVFLQYLYEKKRDVRIVPLLVGSFHDCVGAGAVVGADIHRMVEALRRVEAETDEPICYLISGDLAHIGPKFGDFKRVGEPALGESCDQDQSILQAAAKADASAFFQVIASEGDRRRICGLPPTWTFLEACQPGRGQLLAYDQYVHPLGNESVSFASMAFYR